MTMLPEGSGIEEALEWFMRLTKRSVSANELLAFQDWRRNPANAAAYAEIERSRITTANLTDLQIEPSADVVFAPAPKPTITWSAIPRPRTAFGMAGVALAMAAASIVSRDLPTSYETKSIPQRLVRMIDGACFINRLV